MASCDNISFTAALRPIEAYTGQQVKGLTREERDLWIDTEKNEMLISVGQEDKQFLKDHKINVTRLAFFLVHEWVQRRKAI